MKEVTRRAIERIGELRPQDWAVLAARAQAYRVGGDAWETAWLAARAGHAAGIPAQSRAILAGAAPCPPPPLQAPSRPVKPARRSTPRRLVP